MAANSSEDFICCCNGNSFSCRGLRNQLLEENSDDPRVLFYGLPKKDSKEQAYRRKVWLERLGIEEADLPEKPAVCGVHFDIGDFTLQKDAGGAGNIWNLWSVVPWVEGSDENLKYKESEMWTVPLPKQEDQDTATPESSNVDALSAQTNTVLTEVGEGSLKIGEGHLFSEFDLEPLDNLVQRFVPNERLNNAVPILQGVTNEDYSNYFVEAISVDNTVGNNLVDIPACNQTLKTETARVRKRLKATEDIVQLAKRRTSLLQLTICDLRNRNESLKRQLAERERIGRLKVSRLREDIDKLKRRLAMTRTR